MKNNKKMIGVGLGFNLMIYYSQTEIPYNLFLMEEEKEIGVD